MGITIPVLKLLVDLVLSMLVSIAVPISAVMAIRSGITIW